jgi:hypothetical protein
MRLTRWELMLFNGDLQKEVFLYFAIPVRKFFPGIAD